ncbi:MAG TPA: hypothetical protein ENH25_11285, partial [candidate division Zixibacteria bacterium]|nr:hypothetical protein [candidate division Zixibacteria bacterium]
MSFAKIFKFAKKGSKAASKQKGKKGEAGGGVTWPGGTRIGIFGHDNSGKTVYYTVLNEECKISKNLQISVTDNATAGEFLSNYRAIWGLGTTGEAGTVVDFKGEQQFPDATKSDKVLQFTAVLNRRKKIPVVAYDYNGKAVSITEHNEMSDKIFDFMAGSDGLLFFFDPKVMGAELQTQAHVASFVNMLERLAPLNRRLPIPIALVITKADILPGFSENQTVLVSGEDEHFIAEEFELFVEKVLGSNRIASNSEWAGSVRNVLVKLREFLRIVIGRTLDFQIFFVSNTGSPPEKIGTDVGHSIYAPPSKIRPIGVREPFYWLLSSIVRSKRIALFRKAAKFVVMASIIWMIFYSLPFLYHFKYLLPKPVNVEQKILKVYDGNYFSTTESERQSIIREYRKYENRWIVKQIYPDFQLPAKKIREIYSDFNVGKAITRLDNYILDFSRIVKDSTVWPRINPSNDSLILQPDHERLLAGINELHAGDESSTLFMRSDRTLTYWNLFTRYIASRNDTMAAAAIMDQVKFDRTNSRDLSNAEKQLGDALNGIARFKKTVVAKKVDSKKAVEEFESLKDRINNSTEPAFILGKAVSDLKKIRKKLDSSTDSEQIASIDKYLNEAKKWSKKRRYVYKIESIPDMGHIHVEVTADGESPNWSLETQFLEGDEYALEWKIGDDIHIAFDELKHKCQWGKLPSDKTVFKGKYSVFDMDGSILFNNIGKTIIISFKPALMDQLPKLE